MLTVRCGRAAREGSIYIYGLAEEEDGGGWSLVFSTDQATSEGYSLSTAAGATCYDALEGWALADGVLRLLLTADAAAALGLPEEIWLRLETNHVDIAEVRDAMAHFS